MKKIKTTRQKFETMWNRMKGNLRCDPVRRYPWESDEEYQIRCDKIYNPDMPSSIIYHTGRGPIEISFK